LEGEVDWDYQRTAAGEAVRYLNGMIGVHNGITVKARVSPADVKSKIEAAFQRNAAIDARRVHVDTNGTKVTLRGRVCSWAERDAAQQAVWAAPGVSSVENLLEVTP
jgi:osmotically-inducible protein OsmY